MKRFTIILIFFIINITAQELPVISTPPPQASSLLKFTEIPVSHYTGLPTINIPIYEVNTGDIKIPISLSYHARGIKVEEIASNVGIGWALNAGGVISRQIRGKKDGTPSYGYLNSTLYNTFFSSEATRQLAWSYDINNQIDLQPDLFRFNFLGFSGKFIYDRATKKPVLQSFSDLKIETIGDPSSDIQGFVITDEYGYKYQFGISVDGLRSATDTENIINNYIYSQEGSSQVFPGESSGDPSSWYLMDIISPTGESVKFFYESETIETHRRSYDNYDKVGESESGDEYEVRSHFSLVQMTQQRIKEISFDLGKVLFNKSVNKREDLRTNIDRGGYTLDNIEVKSTNNDLIKKFQFNYSYSNSPGDSNVLLFLNTIEPEADKRLFLNSIQEINDVNSIPPYEFTYSSTKLPNRFSNSQDVWGYFNGKPNGQYISFFNTMVNRSVDTFKVQAGLLKKIKYPTGGSVTYEYESNRAIPESYFENIQFNSINPEESKQVVLDKDPAYYDPNDGQFGSYSMPFTVSPTLVGYNPLTDNWVSVDAAVEISNPEFCGLQENTTCPYLVRVYYAEGGLVGPLHYSSPYASLKPGNFILKVIPNYPEDPYDYENDFGIVISWKEKVSNEIELLYTAGSRIKKIMLEDDNGGSIVKTYEYTYPDDGRSSGKIFSMPEYYYTETVNIGGQLGTVYFGSTFGRSANLFTMEQGNHGGYAVVTEYTNGDDITIGKIEYKFTIIYDSGEFYKPTYHLPTDNEWLRGQPLEIKYYKGTNEDNYTLVKKIYNEYEYGGSEFGIYDLRPQDITAIGNVNDVPYINNDHDIYAVPLVIFSHYSVGASPETQDKYNYYEIYFLNAGTARLVATHQMDYYDTTTASTSTVYEYGSDTHYQVTRTEMLENYSNRHITKNFYPDDVDSLTGYSTAEKSIIERLQKTDLHQMAIPIHTEKYIKDGSSSPELLLSTTRTKFNEWSSNLILPEFIQTSKGSNVLEDRLVYHDYDAYGNPLEVSKADGTSISYVWGYDSQYPIAKLENASYATMTSTQLTLLTNAQNASNTDTSISTENTLRDKLQLLREGFPNAMITTYTYDPLIGVTSITDPKGYTMYYQYDEFNRLKAVKDASGNILSQNEYHYKGQQ